MKKYIKGFSVLALIELLAIALTAAGLALYDKI